MQNEQAFSVQYTNRHPWADFSILQRLAPERLADILNDVKRGECPAEYLELAQDIELKDLHYRSVLSTRKDAVTGLEIKVIPADEDDASAKLALYVPQCVLFATVRYDAFRDSTDVEHPDTVHAVPNPRRVFDPL